MQNNIYLTKFYYDINIFNLKASKGLNIMKKILHCDNSFLSLNKMFLYQ